MFQVSEITVLVIFTQVKEKHKSHRTDNVYNSLPHIGKLFGRS